MADWQPPVECPQCGSDDTHLIVSQHDEILIYECNTCGCHFETEDDI